MTPVVHIIIIILTVLTAILLIGIVLIQKSKGGGLSSQFGGAGSMMGVRQTNSFLEKATWTLASLILVFSIASAFTMPKVSSSTEVRTKVPTQQAATPLNNQFDTNVNGGATTEGEQAPVILTDDAANSPITEDGAATEGN